MLSRTYKAVVVDAAAGWGPEEPRGSKSKTVTLEECSAPQIDKSRKPNFQKIWLFCRSSFETRYVPISLGSTLQNVYNKRKLPAMRESKISLILLRYKKTHNWLLNLCQNQASKLNFFGLQKPFVPLLKKYMMYYII